MAELQNAQVTFITLFAVGFLAAVYSIIALISLLRRLRNVRQLSATYVPATVELGTLIPDEDLPPETSPIALFPQLTPIPEAYRIPVRPGAPEQVILSIEPNDEPTDDQRNVQKLINFLKQEAMQQAS